MVTTNVARHSTRALSLVAVLAVAPTWLQGAPQQASTSIVPPVTQHRALLDKYCVTCHNQRLKTGGLALDILDLDNLPAHAEVWEAVIKKLRGGMMPPVSAPKPDKAAVTNLVTWLEASLDRAYFAKVNPGR